MGFIVAIGSAGGASERRFNPATDVHRWRLTVRAYKSGRNATVSIQPPTYTGGDIRDRQRLHFMRFVSIQPPTYTGGDLCFMTRLYQSRMKFQSSHRRTPVATLRVLCLASGQWIWFQSSHRRTPVATRRGVGRIPLSRSFQSSHRRTPVATAGLSARRTTGVVFESPLLGTPKT